MSDILQSPQSVIEMAWEKYSELNENSKIKRDEYYLMRKWIAYLSVAAVLIAIVYDNYHLLVPEWAGWVMRILLILTPIVSSSIAAFGKQFQQGKQYLALRGAAEEVKKEIFLYRTLLRNEPDRHKILSGRLAKIMRTMFQAINGELVLKPYKGKIPPYYDPKDEKSDPGFTDLSGDEYFTFRLEDQLSWHKKRINQRHNQRRIIQIWILFFGGLGAFLAAIGGDFAVWVALTVAISSAFIGWEELRGLDETVSNYSRVVLELEIIHDRWLTLQKNEKTEEEFYKMVKETEDVMRAQHSKWMKSMQENFAEAEGEEAELVNSIIKKARETDQAIQEKMAEEAYDAVSEVYDQAYEQVALSVDDSAEDVKERMSSIADEVQDGFETDEDNFVDVPDDEFIDEVFDDVEDGAFDMAVEDGGDVFNEVLDEGEILEDVPDEEFVDEVFQDEEWDESEGVG
jgi:hypothetical protein